MGAPTATPGAAAAEAGGVLRVPPNVRMGLLASLAALGILLIAAGIEGEMGLFWAFGLAFGFVLQRSRFCFAGAFRDIFLLGHGRTMKGLLLGLAVATLGFAAFMSRVAPNPQLGSIPTAANVLPLGWHVVVGGLLFGVGMVVAGNCVSGSVYRMGEGYVASWVSFGGILLGLFAASYTWNWWWEATIESGPRIWLPAYLGHAGAVAVTLGGLLLAWLAVLWWESRSGVVIPEPRPAPDDDPAFGARLRAVGRNVFVHGWPVLVGGAVLGGLNVLLFVQHHPWGFTGELSRWVIGGSNALGFGPGQLAGADQLPGCALDMGEGGLLHHMLFLVWGMVMGSFVAALFAREFKIRRPRRPSRYWQSAGGGVLMGVGATLGMGCTIGSFFSAIPSLALNGWLFALFLAIGAWLGTQLIKRIG